MKFPESIGTVCLIKNLSGIVEDFDLQYGETQRWDTVKQSKFAADYLTQPKIDSLRTPLESLLRKINLTKPTTYEKGMNTLGILFDRLTILVCKLKFSSNKSQTYDQMLDIVSALETVCPTKNFLLEKDSRYLVAKEESTVPHVVLARLQIYNYLMWKTQDILYVENIESLDSFQIKGYITTFRDQNLERNNAIQKLEKFFSL